MMDNIDDIGIEHLLNRSDEEIDRAIGDRRIQMLQYEERYHRGDLSEAEIVAWRNTTKSLGRLCIAQIARSYTETLTYLLQHNLMGAWWGQQGRKHGS
jgi:hypothetical protein